MQMSARSVLISLLCVIALALMLTAVFTDSIGIDRAVATKDRILVFIVGAALLTLVLLRRRTMATYQFMGILLLNCLALLLVMEIAATVLKWSISNQESGAAPISTARLEVDKTSVIPAMYVGWQGHPFIGKAITIGNDGLRVTGPAAAPGTAGATAPEPIRIFAFGGSTMWGEGAADQETIPAYLQRELSSRLQHPVKVINFGQRAWVSTQSLIQLILELQRGNIPDHVVFYDGYNDTFAAYATGQVGVPENFMGFAASGSESRRFLSNTIRKTDLGKLAIKYRDLFSAPSAGIEKDSSKQIANAYLAIFEMVGALAKQYRFSYRFYWQPQLFIGHKPLTNAEQKMREDHPWLRPPIKTLTQKTYAVVNVKAQQNERLEDISNAFDETSETIYLDPVHVMPEGNRLVAQAMLANGLLSDVRASLKAKLQAR